MTARPFFIVSSGRSGTAMLHKALAAAAGVEMHHEYMVNIVQPLAVRRYMGWIDADAARQVLEATHVAAVRHSAAAYWGDSSNKLSWLIPDLAQLLPGAKFVHLVRDGRKVASSFFHKLAGECYDDRSTSILRHYARDPVNRLPPPPEKKYWWPLPRSDAPWADAFAGFDQFERIVWHWCEINRVILCAFPDIPAAQRHFVRLEDLHQDRHAVTDLFDFLHLPLTADAAALFDRPHNVNRPENKLLDARQRAQFGRIATDMMVRLNYAGRPEYVVNY